MVSANEGDETRENVTAADQAQQQTADDIAELAQSNATPKVWALPWTWMFVMLYLFVIFWVNFAIVRRYYLNKEWGAALPGLDSTPLRKFTMGGHLTCGAIALLIAPIQFVPWFRRNMSWLHRWTGRCYVVCALLSTVCGLLFIVLKGKLVGGWNMTVSFTFGGLAIGLAAFQAWKTARAAKRSSAARSDWTKHRNWGIRSFSQILAPVLYRYWYVALEIYGIYRAPVILKFGGECNADDICPEYLRVFDQIHCWTYWLSSLLLAEVIVYYLPDATKDHVVTAHALLEESDSDRSSLTDREPLLRAEDRSPNHLNSSNLASGLTTQSDPNSRESPATVINAIGITIASITTAFTLKLFLS